MIIGSFTTYYGKINYSVWIYILADCAWVYNSIMLGDILGACVIGFAITLGLGTWYRMKTGKMRKNLNKD